MKKALIHGTRICEIVDPGNEFPVHPDLTWADVADDTTTTDTYVDEAVVKPPAQTAEELFQRLRKRRNEKLVETDHLGLADQTLTDEVKEYRKLLRDLPATLDNSSIFSFDFEDDWPVKP
jgi:hypothetical protein